MASGGHKPTAAATVIDWKECVVSTVAGDGNEPSRDGIGIAAGLSRPCAFIESADGKSLLFTETGSHRIRRYDLSDGRVSTLLGSEAGFKNGDSKSAAFTYPSAICLDPLKPNNLYIGD